jgi:hypothetical protein
MLIIGYCCLVMGTLEFMDWLAGGHGLIAELLINFSNPLLAPPVISFYLLLLAAWCEPLREQIREGFLSRCPLILNPWTYRISLFIQGICYVFLFHKFRQILEILQESDCGFSCSSSLTVENSSWFFLVIIILTFVLQYLLQNLPEIKEVRDSFLPTETVGLYGLNHSQFILEEILGASASFRLIQGARRHFKEKKAIWFTFSRANCDFEGKCDFEVGSFKITSNYQAVVTDTPNQIQLSKVPLAGIESREQLASSIQRDSIIQFRENIESLPDYQELALQLQKFYQNGNRVPNNSQELAQQKAEAAEIRSLIDEFRTKLLNQAVSQFSLHGELYQITFQPQEVRLVLEKEDYLKNFEESFPERAKELQERIDRENKLKLDQLEKIIGLINDSPLLSSRSDFQRVLRMIIAILFPQSMQTEVLSYLGLEKLSEEKD